MHVRDRGPRGAAAVLLVHGQIYDGELWAALAAALEGSWRVLVPDLPGYGRTPPIEPYTLERVEEELESALGDAGVRSVAVVGYSLGAYHALALALRGRLAVSRLVLLGAVAGVSAEAAEQLRELAGSVRAGGWRGSIFADLAVPEGLKVADPALWRRVAAAGDAVLPSRLATELEAIAAMPDLRPRLHRLRVPTLVRTGALDRNTPPAQAAEIAAAIPGAVLEIVPDAGHLYLQHDAPPTVGRIVDFLRS